MFEFGINLHLNYSLCCNLSPFCSDVSSMFMSWSFLLSDDQGETSPEARVGLGPAGESVWGKGWQQPAAAGGRWEGATPHRPQLCRQELHQKEHLQSPQMTWNPLCVWDWTITLSLWLPKGKAFEIVFEDTPFLPAELYFWKVVFSVCPCRQLKLYVFNLCLSLCQFCYYGSNDHCGCIKCSLEDTIM